MLPTPTQPHQSRQAPSLPISLPLQARYCLGTGPSPVVLLVPVTHTHWWSPFHFLFRVCEAPNYKPASWVLSQWLPLSPLKGQKTTEGSALGLEETSENAELNTFLFCLSFSFPAPSRLSCLLFGNVNPRLPYLTGKSWKKTKDQI